MRLIRNHGNWWCTYAIYLHVLYTMNVFVQLLFIKYLFSITIPKCVLFIYTYILNSNFDYSTLKTCTFSLTFNKIFDEKLSIIILECKNCKCIQSIYFKYAQTEII